MFRSRGVLARRGAHLAVRRRSPFPAKRWAGVGRVWRLVWQIGFMGLFVWAGSGEAFAWTIRGRVLDRETRRPVADAVVVGVWTKTEGSRFYLDKLVQLSEATTDGEGRFTLESPWGWRLRERVTVYKAGYVAWHNERDFPTGTERRDKSVPSTILLAPFPVGASRRDHYFFVERATFCGYCAGAKIALSHALRPELDWRAKPPVPEPVRPDRARALAASAPFLAEAIEAARAVANPNVKARLLKIAATLLAQGADFATAEALSLEAGAVYPGLVATAIAEAGDLPRAVNVARAEKMTVPLLVPWLRRVQDLDGLEYYATAMGMDPLRFTTSERVMAHVRAQDFVEARWMLTSHGGPYEALIATARGLDARGDTAGALELARHANRADGYNDIVLGVAAERARHGRMPEAVFMAVACQEYPSPARGNEAIAATMMGRPAEAEAITVAQPALTARRAILDRAREAALAGDVPGTLAAITAMQEAPPVSGPDWLVWHTFTENVATLYLRQLHDAIVALAQGRVAAGDRAAAVNLLSMIAPDHLTGKLLSKVANVKAEAGDVAGALELASRLPNSVSRVLEHGALIKARVQAGDIATALALAATWDRRQTPSPLVDDIAPGQVAAGDLRGALETLAPFPATGPGASFAVRNLLADIARKQAEVGQIEAAWATAERFRDDSDTWDRTVLHIVVALARIGVDDTTLEQTLGQMRGTGGADPPYWRKSALVAIARVQAEHGDLAGPLRRAANTRDPSVRAAVLLATAEGILHSVGHVRVLTQDDWALQIWSRASSSDYIR